MPILSADPNKLNIKPNGAAEPAVHDRAIGEIIKKSNKLTDEQVKQILDYQSKHGLRFGEAAIALRLASHEDVLKALASQFHYAYTPGTEGADVRRELIVASDPFSEEAEAFRDLRSQLLIGVFPKAAIKSVAILSPNVGDGKTYVAANLAVSLSQLGEPTLLVDADLRTPRQHKVFDIPVVSGLSSMLSGRGDTSVIQRIEQFPSLYIMPAGPVPPNPLELLQRPAFGLMLKELHSKFEYVVIDTPAAQHGADCRVVSAYAGSTILVGRRNRTKMDALSTLSKRLGKVSSPVAGIILNDH